MMNYYLKIQKTKLQPQGRHKKGAIGLKHETNILHKQDLHKKRTHNHHEHIVTSYIVTLPD